MARQEIISWPFIAGLLDHQWSMVAECTCQLREHNSDTA